MDGELHHRGFIHWHRLCITTPQCTNNGAVGEHMVIMNRKKARGIAAYILALALAAGSFQCIDKPMDPVMPRWDIDLSAPVTDKTYSLSEIVDRSPDVLQVAAGSTLLQLKTSVKAQPTYVGDRIALDPISTAFSSQVGAFSINSASFSLPITIPGLTAGQTQIIPPIPARDVPAANGNVPYVQSAVLQSGTVTLTIENHMPVPMRIESLIIVANEAGGTIGQFDFGTTVIASGSSRSVSANLAGVTVRQRVLVQNIRVSSPGSGTSVVTIPNPMLVAVITSTNLVATSATVSNVDAQHTQVTRSIPLNSETLIKDVWINRGTLNLHVVSDVALQSTLRFRLLEVLTQSGAVYERVINLGARGSQDVSIDLSRCRIHGPANGFVRSLTADVIADVPGSSGSYVTISSTDQFSASVSSSVVVADSAIAVLKPTVIAIDQNVALSLGDITKKFKGSLDIPNASLQFTPQTSMNVPMQLDLRLESKGGNGSTVTLQVPVTKGNAGLGTIDFAPGDVGTFLSRVSGNIPDSLRVVGNVILNPDYDTTMTTNIGRNGSFAGEVAFSVPMSLRIVGGCFADTVVMGDTTNDGKTDQIIDPDVMKDVNLGRMHLEIDNGLPLGVKVKVVLLDNAHNPVLTIPQGEGDSLEIAAGLVVNGDVQSAAHSSRVIELRGTELTQFNNAAYVRMNVSTSTPGATAVNFHTTDNVRVRVWSEFSYRVNQ
jgi:hypothetical protein